MIKVTKLNKYYFKGKRNENHVLNDINLEFDSTGLVCILGESGCGKTTLLNTIGGLDDFQSGEIIVGESKVSRYSLMETEKFRNEHMGFVFQNYYLLMDYTVFYNIKLALNIYDISEEEKNKRVEYVLNALDINKYRKKLVSELSGGQQQRVSIARALVKSPDIILADEPTGNLDEENTIRTMSILKNISKECLVIVVTHEKDIADFFADRIIKVRDGKVYKDKINNKKASYIKKYDSNIYLKELEKVKTSLNELDINLYGRWPGEDTDSYEDEEFKKPDDVLKKINLTFAFKDGKLYIKNDSDTDVILTTEDDDCQLINDHRPKLDAIEVDNFNYDLEHLEKSSKGKFSGHEIRKLAHENLKQIGKKQFFIIVILILTSVLMTVGIANYMNKIMTPIENIVTFDERYLQVNMETTGEENESGMTSHINSYIDEVLKAGKYTEIYPINRNMLDITYDEVKQISKLSGNIDNVCYVAYNHLDPNKIVAGRMPEKPDEIVLDEWLVNKYMNNGDIISEVLNTNNAFVGRTVKDPVSGLEFKIVGICRTNQPSAYIHDIRMGIIGTIGVRLASNEQVDKYFGKKFKKADFKINKLEFGEAIVTQDYYEKAIDDGKLHHDGDGVQVITVDNQSFRIMGITKVNFGADFIVPVTRYNDYKFNKIKNSRSFIVYTKDAKEANKFFKEEGKQFEKYFKVTTEVTYKKQLEDYNKRILMDLNFASFLTLGIFIVSLFVIYFMIKSNALSRSEELTVYRLIGISRFSIMKTYMLEISLLTLYFAFPPILITTVIIKFFASIPSLQLAVDFPWWSAALLALGMLLINNIISVMPVLRILSKPPAQLSNG